MDQAGRLARAWIETWDSGDPESLPLTDDFVHESPFGRLEGRARYLDIVRPMAEANVAKLEVEDVVAEGDRACVRFTMTTAKGPVACCDWVTVRGDQIASVRSYYDSRDIPEFEKY